MSETFKKRLPLRAVEVFEAAAREGGVTAAARRLGITPPAVSRHLRNLEERLGVHLFEPGKRPALPTEAARTLLPAISDALDRIAEACRNLGERGGGKLVVSCSSASAAWLVPWAAQFGDENPDIKMDTRVDNKLTDFHRDCADVALRYGGGEYPAAHAEKLLDEVVAPLCSPDFLRRHPIRKIADLPALNLIESAHHSGAEFAREEWDGWLQAMGAPRGPEVVDFATTGAALAMQLAVDGKGVILGRGLTALEKLKNGELVAPLNFSTWTGHAYYFVCPRSGRSRSATIRFADRLRSDLAAHAGEMKKHFPSPREFPVPPPENSVI